MAAGFTYLEGCRAYDAMISCFEDAVVNGLKVRLGHVGALTPYTLPPREVNMGFERLPGNIVIKKKRQIILGQRKRWKLEVFPAFTAKHHLNWFSGQS